MTTDIKAAVLRNELAIIIGCLDGRSAHEKAESVIAWMDKYDQRATIQPVAVPEPVGERDLAPPNSLPNWSECNLRVENSDFIAKRVAEGGYGAEPDSKLATELHRFIYEYDAADAYRSAWFMHRLELVLEEARRDALTAAPAQAASDEVRDAKLYGFDREELEAIADGLESGYDKSVNVGGSPLAGCDDNRINTTTMDASKFIRAALRTTSTDSQKGGA